MTMAITDVDSNSSSAITTHPLSAEDDPAFHTSLLVLSSCALLASVIAVLSKLVFVYIIPISWKCSLLLRDISSMSVAIGLVLVTAYVDDAHLDVCRAGGFFMLFGTMDMVFNLSLVALTLIVIQDPCKMSQLSTFRWGLFLSIVIPQKVIFAVLAMLPVTPLDYFKDEDSLYPLACFPIRQEGEKGATFGAILVFIVWTIIAMSIILCVVNAVRFHRGPGTRIHASSPSLWQTQKVEQGKSFHKFSFLDLGLVVVMIFLVTIIVYTNNQDDHIPQWIAFITMAVITLLRSVIAGVQFVLWSRFCCNETAQKKEPHHRLKQLQLIKNEGPGKLRMKANWTARKGVWKQGLLKVYGPSHIKAWAQEIVVLGLLRKSRSASVLQCLWTSNSNPYYETMTLISGEIVTSDSRLTCLELTSSGTLQDLLKTMDVPLPEPCQRTIMHDIAEGLSYLHDQNVLHRNLTSAAVYLKGSVQCLVLRAAVGDFEDAQIYGTFLTGSPNSNISRKRFFYPDIRAFALVGIEMLSRICECRRRERQPNRRTAARAAIGSGKGNTFVTSKHSHHRGIGFDNNTYMDNTIPKPDNDTTDPSQRNVLKRFEKQEIPYCAPGEAEYVPSVKENAVKKRESPPRSPKHLPILGENQRKGYEDNHNWKLQSKGPVKMADNSTAGLKSSSDNEYMVMKDRYQHSSAPGITKVKEAKQFEFPNNSVFRAADKTSNTEDLDMIEEEIERNPTMQNVLANREYRHGGYVTSKTEDGREIFIPAIYKSKNSGANSSSGYGSCGGSASVTSDYFNSAVSSIIDEPNPTSGQRQVHKTVSAATVSSFGDDILEVLPALADEKPRTGEELLKELMKAKQDAKVEQLIESFKERFRRGELGSNGDGVPYGVIFPKKDRQGTHETGVTQSKEPAGLPSQIEKDLNLYDSLDSVANVKTSNPKKISPRPKTAMASMTQHFNRGNARPMSANSSFSAWNARNSLKRTKARQALKKALGNKGNPVMHQANPNEDRGKRGKEVEMKYANRNANARTTENNCDIEIECETKETHNNQGNSPESLFLVQNSDASTKQPSTPASTFTTHGNAQQSALPSTENGVPGVQKRASKPNPPPVSRKPSTKSKPAPPPPRRSPNQSTNKQNATVTGIANLQIQDGASGKGNDISFNDDDSFTSVEPQSMSSASATSHKDVESQREENVMDITEKIQTDMNKIIHGEATNNENSLALPPGIRLIDSGFDSESVTSEESCLCAAAALQPNEDGSCSCPSEALSQGTCSCACSNCMKESQPYNKDSSWLDSQDSESWSNSNSFSSYDTNMHRRKLPTKRDRVEPSGGALGPDEQYPSPAHRSKHRRGSNNSLLYSPKRNRRSLNHMRGNFPSSASSDTSSAASRRYRELVKKGVPLRVSVVSGDTDGRGNMASIIDEPIHPIAENEREENYASNELYGILDENGMQETGLEAVLESGHYQDPEDQQDEEEKYCQISTIPSLDEIIKEIPDETGQYPDETKAFLNRPESEVSLKALQAVLSRHGSATDGKQFQDAELRIDRLFSSQFPEMHSNNGVLELDESAIKEIAMLPNRESDDYIESDIEGLLVGMDGRHVRYCHNISSRIHLVNFNELLPANTQAFDQLKGKLQINGSVGMIGTQLIDLIQACWLSDNPPATAALVEKLTDDVTETEL